jgi:hypothetical protein
MLSSKALEVICVEKYPQCEKMPTQNSNYLLL